MNQSDERTEGQKAGAKVIEDATRQVDPNNPPAMAINEIIVRLCALVLAVVVTIVITRVLLAMGILH